MASGEALNGGPDFRLPCSICCRKFTVEALGRHEKICEKSAQKKRKIFDSAKQRLQGTDIPAVSSAPAQLISTSPTRQSIRQKPPARKQKQDVKPRPQPPSLSIKNRLTADLVQCPSCERNFSEKAAERHIPWCKEQNSRIPRSPPCNEAKVRQNARTQYKAPLPGKRRCSPLRNISPTKAWPQVQNNSSNNNSNSNNIAAQQQILPPNGSQSVKVTGTAINAKVRNNDIKKPTQTTSMASEGNLSNVYGGSNGMIHSTSWEWVTPHDSVQNQLANPSRKLLPKSEQMDDTDYDPYTSAQKQMQELMLGTSLSPNKSPHTVPQIIKPPLSHHGSQPRSNHSSQWSLESGDDDIEEIEEMIEDLAIEDDSRYEELINQLNKGGKSIRCPRRTVSRDEALFGTKNSLGSQDSDYGSLLMHRSPSSPAKLTSSKRNGGRLHDLNERNLLSSTSSSETSLPPLDLTGSGKNGSIITSSRYCHDCGTKYPISNAKFCCECGTRRLCTA